MKLKFIKKHFSTITAKNKALTILGKKVKTHAEFVSVLEKLSYSKLKTLI